MEPLVTANNGLALQPSRRQPLSQLQQRLRSEAVEQGSLRGRQVVPNRAYQYHLGQGALPAGEEEAIGQGVHPRSSLPALPSPPPPSPRPIMGQGGVQLQLSLSQEREPPSHREGNQSPTKHSPSRRNSDTGIVNIYNYTFKEAGFQRLGNYTTIHTLDLTGSTVEGNKVDFIWLCQLTQLQRLVLARWKRPIFIERGTLAFLTNLRELDLSGVQGLDNSFVASLSSLVSLRVLNLTGCSGIDLHTIEELQEANKRLKITHSAEHAFSLPSPTVQELPSPSSVHNYKAETTSPKSHCIIL